MHLFQIHQKAEQAQNEFNKKLKEGNNFYTDAKKEIIEVEANLRLAEKGTIDGAKALENYNTKLSGTFGAATDVVSALKNIQDNKTAYITALVQMTAAQDLLTLAVNKSSEALGLEQKGKPGFFSYLKTVGETIGETMNPTKWEFMAFPKMLDKIARTGEITYQNYFNKIDKLRQESADGVTSYTQEIDKIANKYKDDPFIASLLGLDTGDKGKNENLKKASENRALMLAQFDYETKIMEAQAKSLERGRERDIQLAEADYTKKLNQSAIHLKKLEEQEKKGVKGATAALAEARKQHAEYEIALTEEKSRKIFEIESKYSQMRINLALDRMQKQFATTEALGGRSAKQMYDDSLANIEAERELRAGAIDLEITDADQKSQALALLDQEYISKKAIAQENFRKNSLKEEEAVLSNRVDATKKAFNDEMTAEQKAYEDSKALLQLKMDEEIRQAGDNEALILSIRQKYAQATIDLDEKVRVERAAKFAFWADKAKQLGSDVGAFMQAKDNFELQSYAKTIKGKANYDQLYAKKKMELEIKQAKREKAIGIFNATIDTASAIMDIWAKNAGNPILAGILTALAAATGIAQIATIASTPLPSADSSSGSGSVDVPTTTVTEKFHTGTYRPSTKDEEKEITRTLLTTERVLSPQQTTLFDNIIGRMQSYGGSGQIMQGVGVSAVLEEKMIERAFTKAIERMPNPVMTWSEFENQAARQSRLRNNAIIR